MQKESPPCRSSAGRLKERRRTPKTEGVPFIYYTRFSGRKAIDETDKGKTSGLCKSPKVRNFQKDHEKGLTFSGNHAIMITESKGQGSSPQHERTVHHEERNGY